MTPDDAFLQVILESPDDDTPRLIYPDWLEEHGQPERAEFIRVQCEVTRLPTENPQWLSLAAREQVLLEQHEEEWVGSLRPILSKWAFHRGLLGVDVSVPNFLVHAASLFRCPLFHYIDIWDHAVGRTNVEALAASPFLARVTVLDLAGWDCYDPQEDLVDDEQVRLLAMSGHTTGLKLLNLRCNAIGDDGVRALAASPSLRRLRNLDLRANRIGDEGLLALARSELLPSLMVLDLGFNEGFISDAGWQAMAASCLLPLTWLNVGGNRLSDRSRDALAARFGDSVYFCPASS